MAEPIHNIIGSKYGYNNNTHMLTFSIYFISLVLQITVHAWKSGQTLYLIEVYYIKGIF